MQNTFARARTIEYCINDLYARYLCSLGRPCAARDDGVSCIQINDTFTRTRLKLKARPSARDNTVPCIQINVRHTTVENS